MAVSYAAGSVQFGVRNQFLKDYIMFSELQLDHYKIYKEFLNSNGVTKIDSFLESQKIESKIKKESGVEIHISTKFHIIFNQKEECLYCGRKMDLRKTPTGKQNPRNQVTRDHILPKSKGNDFKYSLEKRECENMILCCRKCNMAKANKNVFQFLFELHGIKKEEIKRKENILTKIKNQYIIFSNTFFGTNLYWKV